MPIVSMSDVKTTRLASISTIWGQADVTTYESMSSRLQQSLAMLNETAELKDNWDGYKSRKLEQNAVRAARRLLVIIDREMPPVPEIVPTPLGGVDLVWEIQGRKLELVIDHDGAVCFFKESAAIGVEDGDVDVSHEEEVQRIVRWLLDKTS